MPGLKVLFRADAGERMGAGHLLRSIALAEGFAERGFRPVFLTRTEETGYLSRLSGRSFDTVRIPASIPLDREADEIPALIAPGEALGLIADRYDLPEDYFLRLKGRFPSWALGFIDDWGRLPEGADFILNQNLFADKGLYARNGKAPPARVLAGARYALLRSEFRRSPPPEGPVREKASRILVTLGGGDPENRTLAVLEALGALEGFEIHAVSGPAFRHTASLEAFAAGRPAVTLHKNVENMFDLMKDCDLAVTGAGTTLWELFYMGLPSLIYILAENQARSGEAAGEKGCAVLMGRIETFEARGLAQAAARLAESPDKRRRLRENAQAAVDGHGVARAVEEFLSFAQAPAGGGRP